jgi:REP element-mobilizing transposase RayT
MSEYEHKSHNVSVLLYHIVCPIKYRRAVISESVEITIRQICEEISKRYEIKFLEIGMEGNHVHFLVQSVPAYSPAQIVRTIKSIIAKKVMAKHPEIKIRLWGGEFWTSGYYISTVSKHGDESVISNYVKQQGTEEQYKQLKKLEDEQQPSLFD